MRINKYVILTCMIMASNEVLSQSLNDPNPFGIKLEMPSMLSTHGDEHKQGIDYSKIKIPEPRSQDSQPVIGDISYSKELEKSAKRGVSSAQVELGKCYLFGRGIQVDDKKAQKWFEEAIKQGNPDAMFWLGYMYETQRAKKIKLASGWNKHFMPEYFRERTDEKERDAYRNAAKEYFEKAASLGQPDALYKLYQQSCDLASLKTSAEKGHVKAQYDYAAYILNQFKSDNSETTLGLAKKWFAKAAENGHPDAAKMVEGIEDAEGQIVIAKRDAEERARKEALEAARRDSIAAVELARQMAEAEQRRKQDSIDIAQGRKLPTMSMLLANCIECNKMTTSSGMFGVCHIEQEDNRPMMIRFSALCSNDQLRYYQKSNLDELDKELYKKSSKFKEDKIEFDNKRKGTYGILVELKNSSMKFFADGFTINDFYNYLSSESPIYSNYLKIEQLLFPIKPQLWITDGDKYKFPCGDVEKLQAIRASASEMALLLMFKPLVNCEIGLELSVANPVGLYLVNKATGNVILDLNSCIRKTNLQSEKAIIARGERFRKAKIERSKPKKHSTPKQVRCLFCGGKGYTEDFPIGSTILKRYRCTNCYGKGYTMEYYY